MTDSQDELLYGLARADYIALVLEVVDWQAERPRGRRGGLREEGDLLSALAEAAGEVAELAPRLMDELGEAAAVEARRGRVQADEDTARVAMLVADAASARAEGRERGVGLIPELDGDPRAVAALEALFDRWRVAPADLVARYERLRDVLVVHEIGTGFPDDLLAEFRRRGVTLGTTAGRPLWRRPPYCAWPLVGSVVLTWIAGGVCEALSGSQLLCWIVVVVVAFGVGGPAGTWTIRRWLDWREGR